MAKLKANTTIGGYSIITSADIYLGKDGTSPDKAANSNDLREVWEKAVSGWNLASTKLAASANAVSSSKWSTSRTLTFSGDVSGSVSIDGSANKTISLTVLGNSHNHSISNVTNLQSELDKKSNNHNHPYLGATSNAVSASKLATARTISLGGDASGSVSFDGTGNITLSTTVKDDSHNHIVANVDGLQSALDAKSNNHSHPYLLSGGGTLTGELNVPSIKFGGDDGANIMYDDSNPNAKALMRDSTLEYSGIIRLRADNSDDLSVVKAGAYHSVQGNVGIGDWNIKQNTDGSLGFFIV